MFFIQIIAVLLEGIMLDLVTWTELVLCYLTFYEKKIYFKMYSAKYCVSSQILNKIVSLEQRFPLLSNKYIKNNKLVDHSRPWITLFYFLEQSYSKMHLQVFFPI